MNKWYLCQDQTPVCVVVISLFNKHYFAQNKPWIMIINCITWCLLATSRRRNNYQVLRCVFKPVCLRICFLCRWTSDVQWDLQAIFVENGSLLWLKIMLTSGMRLNKNSKKSKQNKMRKAFLSLLSLQIITFFIVNTRKTERIFVSAVCFGLLFLFFILGVGGQSEAFVQIQVVVCYTSVCRLVVVYCATCECGELLDKRVFISSAAFSRRAAFTAIRPGMWLSGWAVS